MENSLASGGAASTARTPATTAAQGVDLLGLSSNSVAMLTLIIHVEVIYLEQEQKLFSGRQRVEDRHRAIATTQPAVIQGHAPPGLATPVLIHQTHHNMSA